MNEGNQRIRGFGSYQILGNISPLKIKLLFIAVNHWSFNGDWCESQVISMRSVETSFYISHMAITKEGVFYTALHPYQYQVVTDQSIPGLVYTLWCIRCPPHRVRNKFLEWCGCWEMLSGGLVWPTSVTDGFYLYMHRMGGQRHCIFTSSDPTCKNRITTNLLPVA